LRQAEKVYFRILEPFIPKENFGSLRDGLL
jgi:hypothetical protein